MHKVECESKMSTNQVTVRLCRNFQFVGFDDKGHAVVLDADPPHGEGTGMRPMDMLIVSLGVCTGMDVVQGLRKLRQKLSNLEIKVSGEKNEKLPHYYKKIFVHYKVWGENIDKESFEKVVRDSEELFCSVGATLKGKAEIVTSYEILNPSEKNQR
jgi:putative redox protein